MQSIFRTAFTGTLINVVIKRQFVCPACYFVFLCKRARVQIAVATLSGDSFRQTVHTHYASVHQAAKLVAVLLRIARITAGPEGKIAAYRQG